MKMFIDSLVAWMDRHAESGMRAGAQLHGRRSAMARLGAALVGAAVLPMLPYDRSFGAEQPSPLHDDDKTCDYWAYCSLDGTRCNACGGTISQCPPGSQASKVSWVGTCKNPNDKKSYLVAYNDCCGKAGCKQEATCQANEGERPPYRIGADNDMNWCMANANLGVHCSTAIVVGVAE
jgi:methylamine dehydrogenase light chain